MNEAVNICNLFVPRNEIIVTTKSKIEKHNNTYKTSQEPVDTAIPLVILVNGRSASASEIVSGAVQDTKAGKLFGTTTYGKGCVQNIFNLTRETGVKLTIAEYYTPSGRSINGVGINPDVEVAATDEKGTNQLAAAQKYIEEEITKAGK